MAVKKVPIDSRKRCEVEGCESHATWRVSWDEPDKRMSKELELLLGKSEASGFWHMYEALMCDKHVSRLGDWI